MGESLEGYTQNCEQWLSLEGGAYCLLLSIALYCLNFYNEYVLLL